MKGRGQFFSNVFSGVAVVKSPVKPLSKIYQSTIKKINSLPSFIETFWISDYYNNYLGKERPLLFKLWVGGGKVKINAFFLSLDLTSELDKYLLHCALSSRNSEPA